MRLRPAIRFSDGHPMDADDVVFSFQAYLDPKSGATQRDLLVVGGQPVSVQKIDSRTVRFEFAAPYAAAERLFDGIAILPRHLLSKPAAAGMLSQAWGLNTPADQIAGLGPFRFKKYVPGQWVVLDRNPYYWKTSSSGSRLPYLDEIVFLFVPSEEVQILQFLAGQTHIISNISAANFQQFKKREHEGKFRAIDLGAGLEYTFLLFNLNEPGPATSGMLRRRLGWFQNPAFRRAISLAIDREAIVRLVYHGLADPIWGPAPRRNSRWANESIGPILFSPGDARALLRSVGFTWRGNALLDPAGNAVEFSILASASNPQRAEMASLIQQDLAEIGISVSVVSLEFRSMLDRILKRREYETAVMTLASGDADPNSEMNVWLSGGSMHLWNLSGKPGSAWESEIDELMRVQMATPEYRERKRLYDRVQWLIADKLPIICLISPHVLAAAAEQLGDFDPAIMRPNALWNAERLYFQRNGNR